MFGSDAKTEDVYDVVSHLVPFACSGGIGTLFTYGQTGSGKTFTVSGLQKMVVRALMEDDDIFLKNIIFITVIELAGNSAYGSYFCHQASFTGNTDFLLIVRPSEFAKAHRNPRGPIRCHSDGRGSRAPSKGTP